MEVALIYRLLAHFQPVIGIMMFSTFISIFCILFMVIAQEYLNSSDAYRWAVIAVVLLAFLFVYVPFFHLLQYAAPRTAWGWNILGMP